MSFVVRLVCLILLRETLPILATEDVTRGVVAADTAFEVYHNGAYVRQDSSSLLLLNMDRATNTGEYDAYPVTFSETIQAGDHLGVKVVSVRADIVQWPILQYPYYEEYPALAGIIFAFEDGTMSTEAWKCAAESALTEAEIETWFEVNFNDTQWESAVVQDEACCPWRDTAIWNNLNSKWIGPQLRPEDDAWGPRTFYCRYQLPFNESRLMDNSSALASPDAPFLNLTQMSVSSSVVLIRYTVDSPAVVHCGVINQRYQLRVPSALELQHFGTQQRSDSIELTWEDMTGGNSGQVYTTAAIDWFLVSFVDECQQLCVANARCLAITFFEVQIDPVELANCKLMEALIPENLEPVDIVSAVLSHWEVRTALIEHVLTIPSSLLPGLPYNAYCSTRADVVVPPQVHSTWEAIGNTVATDATPGGDGPIPNVTLLGGWASDTGIGLAASLNVPGRVFCRAFDDSVNLGNDTIDTITADMVLQGERFSTVASSGDQAVINLVDLQPNTLYTVACAGEGDGALVSSQENVIETLRAWWTENVTVPLFSMRVEMVAGSVAGQTDVVITARMSVIGYMWCYVLSSDVVIDSGVPERYEIQDLGARQAVEIERVEVSGLITDLPPAPAYEAFCTAQQDSLDDDSGGFGTPFPTVSILNATVGYLDIELRLYVTLGPAEIFCNAIAWIDRPTLQHPPPPTRDELRLESPFQAFSATEGFVNLTITGLRNGYEHDVFCFSMRPIVIGPATSVDQIEVEGMSDEAIRDTLVSVLTLGPRRDASGIAYDGVNFPTGNDLIAGWFCIAGHTCQVNKVQGLHLSNRDRLIVKSSPCLAGCECSGEVDADNNGANCSTVAAGGAGGVDPRGAWCYVSAGACHDEEASLEYPDLLVSYAACTKNMPHGDPPTGFYNVFYPARGRARGQNFTIASEPISPPAGTYQLCWCNGTASACTVEDDFRVPLGALHMLGPTDEQLEEVHSCTSGDTCAVDGFQGVGLHEGARLVVLPETSAGCGWTKEGPSAPNGLTGFPNLGVSSASTSAEVHHFEWGSERINLDGGTYLLCWCATSSLNTALGCPPARPLDGAGFLAPAGKMQIRGPQAPRGFWVCYHGAECTVSGVAGYDLRGGDTIMALRRCGEATLPPWGWSAEADVLLQLAYNASDATVREQGLGGSRWSEWLQEGWLARGNTHELPLPDLGLPEAGVEVHNDRGVWGFPRRAVSVEDSQIALYEWGGLVQAVPGTYELCWCAFGNQCDHPTDFIVEIGQLTLRGPLVMPFMSQARQCLRGFPCVVTALEGDIVVASQFLVASGHCGESDAADGVPRDGISIASADVSTITWGDEPLVSPPGRYRLCWCPTVSSCDSHPAFTVYVAMLAVKGPFLETLRFECFLGQTSCTVEGITGEGISNADKAMVMTVCGSNTDHGSTGFANQGRSLSTIQGGRGFVLPEPLVAGIFRLCWCAGESTCDRGPDFGVDLGRILVGGPTAGALYECYQWRPCEIDFLLGDDVLSNGDRLRVIPVEASCANPGAALGGFPGDAVSMVATDNGRRYSWGSDTVTSELGTYSLCWCSQRLNGGDCESTGPFDVDAGLLQLLPYGSFQLASRGDGPPERSDDSFWLLLLVVPLPFLLLVAVILGLCRRRRLRALEDDPEAPMPSFTLAKEAWARIELDKLKGESSLKQARNMRQHALATTRAHKFKKPSLADGIPDFRTISAMVRLDDAQIANMQLQDMDLEHLGGKANQVTEALQLSVQLPGLGGLKLPQHQKSFQSLQPAERHWDVPPPPMIEPNDLHKWTNELQGTVNGRLQAILDAEGVGSDFP